MILHLESFIQLQASNPFSVQTHITPPRRLPHSADLDNAGPIRRQLEHLRYYHGRLVAYRASIRSWPKTAMQYTENAACDTTPPCPPLDGTEHSN